jgi:hypothetical protein
MEEADEGPLNPIVEVGDNVAASTVSLYALHDRETQSFDIIIIILTDN